MNILLFSIFIILGIITGINFFFGKEKFALSKLLYSLWFIAVGVAQLRLSPYEEPWTIKFWLILALFFGLFVVFKQYFDGYFREKIKTDSKGDWQINDKMFFWLLFVMTAITIASNIYIYLKFNTLPIISSAPDKMRFIINREVFGLWEYLALLPRFIIPFSFIYLFLSKTQKWWPRFLATLSIIFGFGILFMYASRVTIVFAILLSYFSYLILNIRDIGYRKIITASLAAMILVLLISVAIPAIRHNITYRDYEYEEDAGALSYIVDLSELRIPKSLNFITPIYIIPSFNLQALMRATDYYAVGDIYFGQYNFSVFNKAWQIAHLPTSEIIIPWKQIFLPWWVTGTFLFSYFVDFSYVGMVLAALLWSAILSGVYILAEKKLSLLSVMLFAYFGFVVIMTIYTNYFMRAEFYLDILVILIVGYLANFMRK